MNYQEYGKDRKDAMIFLHGGGLSWWNYRESAQLLQDEYHIILPVLDGHAGSDCSFTSIEDSARHITGFIDSHLGGSVLLLGGLSLGGQVLLEILSQRPDICRFALVESASVIPAKMTNALIGPSFGASYGLIQNRQFAKLQFRSLHMKPDLFEDYYRDSCGIAKEDLIAFMKASTSYSLKDTLGNCRAETYVFAGQKETAGILRSAELISQCIPGAGREILPGLYHGEFSLNHPDQYAGTVRKIVRGEYIKR